MVIKKSQRTLDVDKPGLKIFDYDIGDDVGITYQELDGRIPAVGAGINMSVDEWYYVVDGTGEVVVDDQRTKIGAGDVVCLPKGTASFLEAQAMKIITITRPNWTEDQHWQVK